MNFLIAFAVVMIFMTLGEWVATATKAFIPSVFITAVLFVIGFWTVLPKNVVENASFGPGFITICITLLLVHLGTLMNLRELLAQWKAVCIALLGVCGTLLLTLTVGTLIFDWKTVVAAVPPLTGGLVSALLMSNGLKAQGLASLVALPVAMFVIHSVVGYPLTSVLLKQESRRLLSHFRANGSKLDPNVPKMRRGAEEVKDNRPKLLNLPEKYQTSAFIMARVAIVGLLAMGFGTLTNNVINSNVVCLIFGVIAHQIGFLEDNALNKAGVFNWLMYGLLAYVFGQLSATTPAVLGGIVLQIIVLIALGVLGMFLASRLLAKPFGMSWQMAFSCSLTALFGFPADYILTSEVARAMATTEDEEEYLTQQMMPKMLVGGFATVSVASVIIATIFLKLL
ncbi:hypothetical protein [Lacticaseibacillus paracasei]|uniref:hypothetical protein n=1 Tax=Lacticaseibacillus paracasei TaxID=1597 RepID=UPI0021C2F033|nr:hypothetical protein [Lacticaseibacillus paracasei]MCP9310170.1 hypothetical protein [Lacticaseibacillus paracasei]MCP9346904.1 hypothetical protein [Lacticaseibacillus paracasei]MCP9366579.1 hypothetical protein [Lacticaseibacillus paracasei]MCP9378888.1 hypothetical protein [Lacticaseibacillus paracasei]